MSSKESVDRAHRIKAEQEQLVAALSDNDLYDQLWRKVLDVFTHKEKPSTMRVPVDYEHDDDCYVSLRLQEIKRRWQAGTAEYSRLQELATEFVDSWLGDGDGTDLDGLAHRMAEALDRVSGMQQKVGISSEGQTK